ncbi:hypothetical protein [Brevibacillus laterosporus]|uniref:hypothetical protein n=1 Tax=Brevibacillus laterosporus TaxID=1465 RepID=UPI001EF2F619|nr:hypothetical protein [Brevibacillus laterosporus]MCG7316155.1 hypothetical protein [Brevibacillus laterosporus]
MKDGITEDGFNNNQKLIGDSYQKIEQYMEFVKEASDFSLGSIVLFEYQEIKDFQNLLDFLPDWQENWLCIGKIMSEPIGINKQDGNVYWFLEIPYDDKGLYFGSFDVFLEKVVFGQNYSEIIPGVDEDDWYQFMIKLGLVH